MAASCLMPCAAGSGQVAIDLGGLVDAIHVASTGVLGMRGVITRNAGPRSLARLDTGARFRVDYFGAWPSITLDPGAQVGAQPRPDTLSLVSDSEVIGWLPTRCLKAQHDCC